MWYYDAVMVLYRQSKVAKTSHQVSFLKLEDGDNYHYVIINNYAIGS